MASTPTSPSARIKLHSIAYTEFEDEAFAWKLDNLELADINLIVGKNATGKSRVLRVIHGLARLIDGSLNRDSLFNGRYKAIFQRDEGTPDLEYAFSIFENKVTSEQLTLERVLRLDRGKDGKGKLRFEKNDIYLDVEIPAMHLASSARRDAVQHPFFEPLHWWASSLKYCEFSKMENRAFSAFEGKLSFDVAQSLPFQDSLHLLVKLSKEKYVRTFESAVISDMRRVGYEITDFGLMPVKGISIALIDNASPQTLFVVEKGIDMKIPQIGISNGMLRALATLIFLHSTRLNRRRDCLLIDDIGEGLDFERASKLISILIEEAEKGFIQLVMTTNDRFVMNGVPLKYWSVIQRDCGKVTVFNKKNSHKQFSDFEEYGFNNFDFFSKEFYSKGISFTKS